MEAAILTPVDRPVELAPIGLKLSRQLGLWAVGMVLTAIAAVVTILSQSIFEYGDEGFHLLASQLINAGKTPYLDFFYQHAPFYIYANAFWMRLFGDSWRSAHAFSAILVSVSTVLIGGYVYTRMAGRRWPVIAGIVSAIFFGLNVLVTEHALVGQPYALSLCLVFVGFLFTVRALSRPNFSPVWAGLASGAAIGVSLLSVPAAPLLLGCIVYNAEGSRRWRKGLEFVIGAAAAALPLGALALRAPRQIWFDTVGYHLTARYTGWINRQEFSSVATAWLSSTEGLLLVFLALVGVAFALSNRVPGHQRFKKELRLCAVMAAGLAACLSLARPAFPEYFLAVLPFMSILATAGLFAISTLVCSGIHSMWFIGVVVALFLFDGAKVARRHVRPPDKTWLEVEQVGALVNSVTPRDCPILCSDAAIYFAARRVPPSGLENNYAFRLNPPADVKQLFHITSQQDINQAVANGTFGTVIAWSAKEAESLNLGAHYSEHQDFRGHFVFWHWADGSHDPCGQF